MSLDCEKTNILGISLSRLNSLWPFLCSSQMWKFYNILWRMKSWNKLISAQAVTFVCIAQWCSGMCSFQHRIFCGCALCSLKVVTEFLSNTFLDMFVFQQRNGYLQGYLSQYLLKQVKQNFHNLYVNKSLEKWVLNSEVDQEGT